MAKKKKTLSNPVNNVVALGGLSLQALFEAGRYSELIALGADILGNPSLDPQKAYVVAASYFRLDKKDKCLEILLQLGAQMNDDIGYNSLIGATYRRLGLLDQAERHLKKALLLSSANNDVANNYANLLIDLGKLSEASQLLSKILEKDPNHANAQANYQRLSKLTADVAKSEAKSSSLHGDAQTQWQAPDPLLEAFDEQLISFKSTRVKASKGPKSTQKQDISKDAYQLSDSLPQPNRNAIALEQIGLVAGMIKEGNFKTALELISAAHQGFTIPSPDVFAHAADVFTQLHRFHEAEICNLHAIALGAESFACYANLVSLATMRGDCQLAAFYFKKALNVDPQDHRLNVLREQIRSTHQSIGRRYSFSSGWHQQGNRQL